MRHRIRLVTLGAALIIMAATLIWASGAAAISYEILYNFVATRNPQGSLIFDTAGNLYGTASHGGDGGCGVCGAVWKAKPNANGTWTVSGLHAFTGADGSDPFAGLIFDAAGINLYGTTFAGGQATSCQGIPSGCGVVFKLAPNPDGTWTESVLHSFTYADGAFPEAGLIFDAAGNLYGTAEAGGTASCAIPFNNGCGNVFKLAPNPDGTWTESILHSFTGGKDGGNSNAGLIFDAAGNLYGTTIFGGSYKGPACRVAGCGVVFKLTQANGKWTESVLHSFTGSDGENPEAGLVFDAVGNLYGTTIAGGASACKPLNGCGVVFKLAPNPDGTWTESVLHSFSRQDGIEPQAGLIFDAAGINLYGTTQIDGPSGGGTVFKLAPNPDGTWTESVLHSFTGVGDFPLAPVILDTAGNLYGTTNRGNQPNDQYGVLFKITP